MSLRRICDLNQLRSATNWVEWRSPGGWLYRYERDRSAVGMETGPHTGEFIWYVLDKNNLTHAKRRVFELINEDEF